MSYTAEQMKTAETSIRTDPFVRDLLETFGASIVPNSISPVLSAATPTSSHVFAEQEANIPRQVEVVEEILPAVEAAPKRRLPRF